MTPLPTGVGNSEEQKAFLQEHSAFLAHYPVLKKIVERAVCRTLAPPPQSEVDRLRDRRDDDAEVVAFASVITQNRPLMIT